MTDRCNVVASAKSETETPTDDDDALNCPPPSPENSLKLKINNKEAFQRIASSINNIVSAISLSNQTIDSLGSLQIDEKYSPPPLPHDEGGRPIAAKLVKDQAIDTTGGSTSLIPPIRGVTCIYCHTTCPNVQALVQHFEDHRKEEGYTICYVCQKSIASKSGLKRHMRTHTGEKPYQCKMCGKCFNAPGSLKRHRDGIHENKRTEPCNVCGKTYATKDSLKIHMRTHAGKRPFTCSECDKCFTLRSSLKTHIIDIHLGKKPYKCTFCPKAFSRKYPMRIHMTTHSNDRPFHCNKCERSFKTKGALTQHDKVLHCEEKKIISYRTWEPEKFACKYCGIKFVWNSLMTVHARIHKTELQQAAGSSEGLEEDQRKDISHLPSGGKAQHPTDSEAERGPGCFF